MTSVQDEEIRAHGSTCLRSHKLNLKPRDAYDIKYADGFTLTQRVRYWGRKARRRQGHGASVKETRPRQGAPIALFKRQGSSPRHGDPRAGRVMCHWQSPWPAGEGRLPGRGGAWTETEGRLGLLFGRFLGLWCIWCISVHHGHAGPLPQKRGRFKFARSKISTALALRPFGPRQEAQNRA